jgi:hypothetical protein
MFIFPSIANQSSFSLNYKLSRSIVLADSPVKVFDELAAKSATAGCQFFHQKLANNSGSSVKTSVWPPSALVRSENDLTPVFHFKF